MHKSQLSQNFEKHFFPPAMFAICVRICCSYQLHLAMGCAKVFMFLLVQSTAVFSTKENSISSRSSYFETRENKQLKGYVVKRFDSPSLLSCSQQCMRNAWCTSTNYKMSSKKDGKRTCELNKHDISLIYENTNFHDQQGVTFLMKLKVLCMGQF